MRNGDAVATALPLGPLPELATSIRKGTRRVLKEFDRLVRETLPSADVLTSRQVRDSIPEILEQMACAIETGEQDQRERLADVTRVHGEARFHEQYNIRELILEYRLLRRILIEEIDRAAKRELSAREWVMLDAAIDLSLQQAVVAFVEHQRGQTREATEVGTSFLRFLTHELRGGLNSIMLTMQWVEYALEGRGEFEQEREGLVTARRSAVETVQGLERLLQAEQLRQRATSPAYGNLQLRPVVLKVAGLLRSAAQRKSLKLDVDVPEDAVAPVDEGLLTLIMQNLLGNAIKYSDRGGIVVTARAQNGNGWILSVADEGRGISPKLQARLFDGFTNERQHNGDGPGFGLFIAAQAARTMGAKISVDSKVGTGSTFSIHLPRGKSELSTA